MGCRNVWLLPAGPLQSLARSAGAQCSLQHQLSVKMSEVFRARHGLEQLDSEPVFPPMPLSSFCRVMPPAAQASAGLLSCPRANRGALVQEEGTVRDF